MQIAKQVEFPFVNVLNNMENRGIKIDVPFFENLKEKSKEHLSELTKSIFNLAEQEFNINSPKQLGEVLFEKLKLTASKKTKTRGRGRLGPNRVHQPSVSPRHLPAASRRRAGWREAQRVAASPSGSPRAPRAAPRRRTRCAAPRAPQRAAPPREASRRRLRRW